MEIEWNVHKIGEGGNPVANIDSSNSNDLWKTDWAGVICIPCLVTGSSKRRTEVLVRP